MATIGEALVEMLRARGVDVVFGIPGVHTIELYRGLASSGIRHVTPRHEQGAAFMADGYARVSGKPGVAFVITGPGVTNALTPMAQARADSVPMLVISGVNRTATLGKGLGHLHELPDQRATMASVALASIRVEGADDLAPAIEQAFSHFDGVRPGPVHIEVPLDVAGLNYEGGAEVVLGSSLSADNKLAQVRALLAGAKAPVILAGGGAKHVGPALAAAATKLDAPVVLTTNARGLMHGHDLVIPASPSLQAVRDLIGGADLVLALGTEFGPTDYDMYATGAMASMRKLIRVDICPAQLARHRADLTVAGEVSAFLADLQGVLSDRTGTLDGAGRAAVARTAAWAEIGADMRHQSEILAAMRDAVPGAVMVGDSTQPVYAGNLYYDHDRAGGWFNAATGYGALGFAIPAAIGASVALPDARVICIAGDGGVQFSQPEMMVAMQERLPITFVIWNNHGYGEIASSMEAVGVEVVGCDPMPPDFEAVAASYGMAFRRVAAEAEAIGAACRDMGAIAGPRLIEVQLAAQLD